MTKKLIAIVMALTTTIAGSFALAASAAGEPTESTTATPSVEVIDTESTATESTPTEITDVEAATESTDNVGVDTHTCAIDKATEDYHRYSCEECDNHSRVYHNEDTMNLFAKNNFFHTWECEGCGYEYAEKHSFSTAYDMANHKEVCRDCGYTKAKEVHVYHDDFFGNYHDVSCDDCSFTAAHHVGVTYTTIDATSCQATCSCGATKAISHDWNGFVCDNCNYIMSGETYAIVDRVTKNDDGSYYVRFIGAAGTHRVDMWDIRDFEGDFVKISHHGNDIFGIYAIVKGNIVNDEENFMNYIISNEVNEKNRDYAFEDLVIGAIEYFDDDEVIVESESGRRLIGFYADKYVVYDLVEREMSDLKQDFAYLTINAGEMIYFVCFW